MVRLSSKKFFRGENSGCGRGRSSKSAAGANGDCICVLGGIDQGNGQNSD